MSSSSDLSKFSVFGIEVERGLIKSKECFYQSKHYKQRDQSERSTLYKFF